MPVGVLKLAMQCWRAPFCRFSNFEVWTVVLSSKMVARMYGLGCARNILLSALVRQRFMLQMPLPKRLSISEISVEASLIRDFLSLMLSHQPFSTKTIMPVSIGLIIWHRRWLAISSCMKSVCKWVQDGTLKVLHIAGKTNPADIFTKEMRDGTHFWRLHDSFMSRLLDFLSALVLAVHHAGQHSSRSVAPAAARVSLSSGDSPFMGFLASSFFFWTVNNISHLLSAGWHLFWHLHGFVPSSLI